MTLQHERDESRPEGPPRGVLAMAWFRWILVAMMAAVAGLSVVYSFGLVSMTSASASEKQYYCPMHPQVVQDQPGDCPICSMSLVLKESGGRSSTAKKSEEPAVSHDGHRHNASDPYFCPMHPEETGADARARCPICKMKLEKRSGASAAAPGSSSASAPADSHAGHRHNPSDSHYCPMHPEETGTSAEARCPICEMKLEKRPPGGKGSGATGPSGMTPAPAPTMAAPSTPPLPHSVPGLVPLELGPDRVQLIGIRTAPATSEELVPELKTVGFVTADESRLARVHARFSGWIERLAVATTGEKVRPGQVLASVFNVELVPAQQELIAARGWNTGTSKTESTTGTLVTPLEQDARTRLELLGMSRGEINHVAKTGKPIRAVSVSAPIGGHVIRKNVAKGTYVQPGTELFEIADLSKVWVLADIYESEIARVDIGQMAEVEFRAYAGRQFPAKVGFIYPTLDAQTRTLRVRLELDNKDLKLRPGMFGDVVIRLGEAQGVVIPIEALVDTGDYQYVFLSKEGGRFEPRRVRPGARSDDKVQILEGLAPGDVVVTTANFLIDSESRLRATIEGTPASGSTPAEPAPPSSCDRDFDKAKFGAKYEQCRQCEIVHRGMGTMEEDCKKAIPQPWR